MINPTVTAATTPNNAQKVKTVVGASDERKRFLAHEEFLIYIITNATHRNAAGAPRACLVLYMIQTDESIYGVPANARSILFVFFCLYMDPPY